MSRKKKKKLHVVTPPKATNTLVIDQNKFNLQKEYHSVDFRTGCYMTEKDRPRKKFKPTETEWDGVF